jgi:uncharacterized membrane protein YfcA
MSYSILYIALGIVSGILSGLIGVGGGIIIVPSLVYLFGFSQHAAQGTTLALMVPPIGLIAAWNYYKAGYVDISVALFIALGFILGAFLGSNISTELSGKALTKIFGFLLIGVGTHLIWANR